MLLKTGSKGNDVKKLQQLLGLSADGVFGKKTEEAVKNFQTKNGLTPDGIVGEQTWNKITSVVKLITEPKVPSIPKINVDLSKLKGQIPESVLEQIPQTISKFGIDTPVKLAHFLAQCAHESGGFKLTTENLNYSVQNLKTVFSKYFPENLAESYARNPEKIGNRVYGGRLGNGPEGSGEGFKFRGRGYIQLTGKSNYIEFGKAINEDLTVNPDLVSTKYPLLSAAWFFSKNCLSKVKDATDANVTTVTRCVNGGTNGLQDRLNYFKKFYKLLS